MIKKLLCVALKQRACSEVASKGVVEEVIEDSSSSLLGNLGLRDRVNNRSSDTPLAKTYLPTLTVIARTA
jgi:hypothetical protein